MEKCIEVKSIREGVYLLWRLKYPEEAQQFIFTTVKNTRLINERIHTIIKKALNDGDVNVIQKVNRYLSLFRQRKFDESQLIWLKRDSSASLYFWLWLIQQHVTIYDDNSDFPNHFFRENRKIKFTQDEIFNFIPSAIEQAYQAALFLLDILPNNNLGRKSDIVSNIRQDYFDYQYRFNTDFVWLVGAENENIQWVMAQFIQHDRILRYFRGINFSLEIQRIALPVIYSLWDARRDTKILFLTALRKRYANMKHRKKVADKSPVNIRISESSKKTLVKLEKLFNRNRADVIEHLIEKAWAERNAKI